MCAFAFSICSKLKWKTENYKENLVLPTETSSLRVIQANATVNIFYFNGHQTTLHP